MNQILFWIDVDFRELEGKGGHTPLCCLSCPSDVNYYSTTLAVLFYSDRNGVIRIPFDYLVKICRHADAHKTAI